MWFSRPEYVLTFLLSGYALFILLFASLKLAFNIGSLSKLIYTSGSVIKYIGLIWLLLFIVINGLPERALGKYALYYWAIPTIVALSTQLLWFETINKLDRFKLVAAPFLLLVINFETYVILVTSIHQDYLSTSLFSPLWPLYIKTAFALTIFTILTLVFEQIKSRISKR